MEQLERTRREYKASHDDMRQTIRCHATPRRALACTSMTFAILISRFVVVFSRQRFAGSIARASAGESYVSATACLRDVHSPYCCAVRRGKEREKEKEKEKEREKEKEETAPPPMTRAPTGSTAALA